MPTPSIPSSNWLALKKKLPGSHRDKDGERPKKKRKTDSSIISEAISETSAVPESGRASSIAHSVTSTTEVDRSPDSVPLLRQMVHGEGFYPEAHKLPGKYIAIDCEMVGIAGDPTKRNSTARDKGDESSLARISVVNYYGYVLLDTFVRQRERVTDWRTAVSGVRESDMKNALSFSETQKLVAALLEDRILVGHAVHNDLRALLLSHPYNLIRDTQVLAGRHGTVSTNNPPAESSNGADASVPVKRNKRQALRRLVSQELGIDIQMGEHSSIIDARATMALYRLHKKIWNKGFVSSTHKIKRKISKSEATATLTSIAMPNAKSSRISSKRKRSKEDDVKDTSLVAVTSNDHVPKTKKQAISSGLSVVVKNRKTGREDKRVISGTRSPGTLGKFSDRANSKWWQTLRK